jgi:phosphoribosylformylglycinamidine (FGAM) synthase-like amidotransferase family enzyme
MSAKKKVLVLTGDGINCEQETAAAFRLAGFEAQIRHLNDLIAEKVSEDQLSQNYSVLAFPGGFSFGDDLTSGKVLAIKIRHGLNWDLNRFASRGGMVLGVCNGFQALIRLGVFGRKLSITHNAHGKFLDTWVELSPQGNRCLWLKGLEPFEVPMRHGEGRIVFAPESTDLAQTYLADGRICLTYSDGDPNGSTLRAAGLTDETGRILGLMPHPEAFVRWTAHPSWTMDRARALSRDEAEGLKIFRKAFEALR